MADFYKFEIANWNEGTAALTLEQEAAYLRVINAIRLSGRALTYNKFALCGMWRCNERKAKRLLAELVEAGKLRVEDGKIINDKALEDASLLRRLLADRASAGRRGGVESGKSRANSLKGKDEGEASASTREEKRRDTLEPKGSKGADAPKQPSDNEPKDPAKILFDEGVKLLVQGGQSEQNARSFLGKLRKRHDDASIIAAIGSAKREAAIDPLAFIQGALKYQSQKADVPQIGDERVTKDGRTMVWAGAIDQWVEART